MVLLKRETIKSIPEMGSLHPSSCNFWTLQIRNCNPGRAFANNGKQESNGYDESLKHQSEGKEVPWV